MSGFVAGVTNPRFIDLPCWDVCCDIETGKITVNKNMKPGTGTTSKEGLEVDLGDEVKDAPVAKMTATQKADCIDNQFMEEVSCISLRSEISSSYPY